VCLCYARVGCLLLVINKAIKGARSNIINPRANAEGAG
jgi:hypothetical protein